MYTVGFLDKNIYRCISDNIITDEVIITNERIQHINERHPNDYYMLSSCLKKCIENPDFIIEANKPNSALILKSIPNYNSLFELVLRLKVLSDPKEYQNSVITFLRIGKKRWNKYLRNKEILYKNTP